MAVAFVRSHTVTSEKVSDNSVALAISTATTPGNVLVAYILFDNAASAASPTVSSIATAAGEANTWTLLGQALYPNAATAGGFANGAMYAIRTSVAWPVASYAVTLSAAVTQKATMAQEFSGAIATLRSTAGTNYSTTTTAASASTTGTAPVIGDLAVGFVFGSNIAATPAGDTDTTAGSWSAVTGVGSTGGSGATNNFGVAQYKVLTAATHQTLNNSAAMTAGNGAIVAVLQQYVDPAITQAAYRFYADGTESASTALAAQDTTPTVDTSGGDVNAQLRVRLQSTTSAAVDPWDDFQLQWERNASGTWSDATSSAAEALVDGYDLANRNSDADFSAQTEVRSQSFMGNGYALTRAGLFLLRTGAPAGDMVVSLTEHTGTFGTSSKPGTVLASAVISLPSVPISRAMAYATFSGAYVLQSGTAYCLTIQVPTATVDASNNVSAGMDTTSPTHPGNSAWSSNRGGSYTAFSTQDLIFEVYGTPVPGTAVPFDSPNLTNGAATTNRLTGGTGTFTAGKVSEDGLADDVGFSGNNHTELLYSLTFKAADLTAGDTLRFRVLRNGSTSGFTYTQVPTVTIGGGGPVDKPIAGTVAAISATSGNPAAVHPLAGVTTATTTTTGTINLVVPSQSYPLSGTVAAVSGTTGTIERQGQAYPLAGTVTATTTTTGNPAARHPLTGVSAATTTTTGATQAIHPLAGVTPATSSTTGTPTAVHPVEGTTTATTTTTGTIGTVVGSQDYPLAGTAAATSTTTGTLSRLNLALAATVAAISLTTGAPTAVHPLGGTAAATSATSGALGAKATLAGTAAATSTTSGTIAAVHPLDGAAAATSATTGNPAAIHPLTGTTAAAVSTTSGTINLVGGPQTYPLSGTVAGTTTTTGTFRARLTLAGTVTATSTTTLVTVGGRPKVWTGTGWASKPAKVWTGSAWVEKPVRAWSGTGWKALT